MQWRYDTRV